MILHFNVTGADRKKMVQAVERVTGVKAKYLGTPSMAYQIDRFTVSKKGTLEYPDIDDADNGIIEQTDEVINAIVAEGFSPAEWDGANEADGDLESEDEPDSLTVEMPRSMFTDQTLENLMKLVESKAELIKESIGADDLAVIADDEKVRFPWFRPTEKGDHWAYINFISKLCNMACRQKRVNAKPKESTNHAYDFRCFLLRLGFIGKEYKQHRKVLMRNFSGSSAFKNGRRKDGGNDDVSGQENG